MRSFLSPAFLARGLIATAVIGIVAAAAPAPASAGAEALLPATTRIAGADRYDQSVLASQAAGFSGIDIVYVASGEKFPDALSAASVAGIHGSPLLLVRRSSLPTSVATELKRLAPEVVVVVGGSASVAESVLSDASKASPGSTVTRIDGADRYEVSRSLITAPLIGSATADRLMLAAGADFPDALSASSAAARLSAPVLLVDGSASAPSPAEGGLFDDLDLSVAIVVGGPRSVSASYEAGLGSSGRTVYRVTGRDRYETGAEVNKKAYTTAGEVFLASGEGFADALSGGPLAAAHEAPLFVVPKNCVPQSVLAELTRLKPTAITLLGGPATLGTGVAALTPC